MAIPAGTRFGTYEVTCHIGSGGMGEVYQAHDSKLGRDVAIKVLPEQFARDPERLARFQREAKMLAALNHPNIATIHGLEQSGDTHYLVMELVPGETLRDRILRDGALPVEEALKVAKQIAEALEAAHEKPIIHRDLKPANVKVTPEGRVKVLDFGLAKAFAADIATEDPSNSPTLSMNPTMQGVIMGTAAYMSPEQAKGKAVDKRTDIFAFGSVLYELLTGKQAFIGEDVGDILATVVKNDPDWTKLPSETPASIKTLLRRCLRKDRHQRLQDAATLRIEIEDALSGATAADPISATPAKNVRWSFLPWAAALVGIVAAAIAVWNLKPAPAPPERPVQRFSITLPPGQQLQTQDQPVLALSPDGKYLAYVSIATSQEIGGTTQLYLRAMDSMEARAVSGGEDATRPFFSPDSQWLGFFAAGKLRKAAVTGGSALNLADAVGGNGASWSGRGTIMFSNAGSLSLQEISDNGGTPQPRIRASAGETFVRWPEILPGGTTVLFSSGTMNTDPRISAYDVEKDQRRALVEGATFPRYFASGHLIYSAGENLMAVPFDPVRVQTTGRAVPVLDDVLRSYLTGVPQYAISATGSLAYVPGGVFQTAAPGRLTWVTRNGTEQPISAEMRTYESPRLSPDGRRLAITIVANDSQIWIQDLSRDTQTKFTFEGNSNRRPVWTPDGKRIAFYSNKDGPVNVYWQMADGSGGLERLTTSENLNAPMSFSPDGKLLAYHEAHPVTSNDIWILNLADRKAQPFLQTRFNEVGERLSPDGRWLAYRSNESGRDEIYVQPYPGPGGKWQISTEGGSEPIWNPNGKEIFFRNGKKMMSVEVSTEPGFSAGKPRVLFEGDYGLAGAAIPNYDVSPDGQRFLMLKPAQQESRAASTQINVVLNWFEELKRRVPTETK